MKGFKLLDLFTVQEQQIHKLRIQLRIEDVQNGSLDHVRQPCLIVACECDCPLEAAFRARHGGCRLLARCACSSSLGNLLFEEDSNRSLG